MGTGGPDVTGFLIAWSNGDETARSGLIEAVYAELFEKKTTAGVIDRLTKFHDFEEIVGVPELRAAEAKYGIV